MYVWIKKDATVPQGIKTETNNTGAKYICANGQLLLATDAANALPQEMIERVTESEHVYGGRRLTLGLYRHEGTTLVVQDTATSHCQLLSIVAPTPQKALDIYSLVRQGKLPPEESWEESSAAPQLPPVNNDEHVEPDAPDQKAE